MIELYRCAWAESKNQAYIDYHDQEWGVPVYDDQKHFEFLILEGAQAGLSWSTVLNKREGYRQAFADFDPIKVAEFTQQKIIELQSFSGIIRNKLKITSAVNNARNFIKIQQEFGTFSHYIWSFVNHQPILNHWKSLKEVPATTKESDALSKDLKKRGFSFVGSTVIYAHMQACGLVNDHEVDCFRYREINKKGA
ncbi:MAG: DNA-3-methyladenine glycosylase I [Cyclobacteriaceae bacterium]